MCVWAAEGEVSAIQSNEEIGEHENHQDRDTEEDYDEKKVRVLGWSLLYLHKR